MLEQGLDKLVKEHVAQFEDEFTAVRNVVLEACNGNVEHPTDSANPFCLIGVHADTSVTALEITTYCSKPAVLITGCILPEQSATINPYHSAKLASTLEAAGHQVILSTNMMHDLLAFTSALVDTDSHITDPDEIAKCKAEYTLDQMELKHMDTPDE